MKTISRTITSYNVNAESVGYVEGVMQVNQLPTLTTTNKMSNVALTKAYKDELKEGQTLVIKSIDEIEKVYEVPVDEFIKLAEFLKNTKPETETK